MDEQDGNTSMNQTTTGIRVTSVVKSVPKGPNMQSPFLIGKSDLLVRKERKSFLSRDDRTLEKLLHLTKGGVDGDNVANTANTKGSYVFTTTEKPNVSYFNSNRMGDVRLITVSFCFPIQVLKRRSDNMNADDAPGEMAAKKQRLSKVQLQKTKPQQNIFKLLK